MCPRWLPVWLPLSHCDCRQLRDVRAFEVVSKEDENFIGPVPGIQLGDTLDSFAEMMRAGEHGVGTQGICGRKGVVVGSIVLNGG